jgi:tetratricopeptide (TPR) repeat protein
MNLRQLRYFIGVVDAGNMTRAAEQLHVAQTALGMQIRQLEEDLGVALLVRHSRGVEPTRAGNLLRARALDILSLVEQARKDLRLNRWDDAIADYDATLKIDSRKAYSLYGRGIAKLRKGDTAAGQADIAAAKAAQANIAEEFAKYGVKPDVVVAAPAPSAPADCARAETHWKSAEEIRTLAVYRDHIARFPNCDFAALAKARIEALQK